MPNDIDELIGLARDLADEVVVLASELLLAGAEIERVHNQYVIVAIELLTDAETQCVLAAANDSNALAALGDIVNALANLRDKARTQAGQSGG